MPGAGLLDLGDGVLQHVGERAQPACDPLAERGERVLDPRRDRRDDLAALLGRPVTPLTDALRAARG